MEWVFFFFKQKTAYEMRISDWSSDVCSSDLLEADEGRLDSVREQVLSDIVRRPGQDDPHAASRRLAGEALDGVGRGRIQKRHGGEVEDQRLVGVGDALEYRTDRRGRSEEERAGDPVDHHRRIGRGGSVVWRRSEGH